jgi:hypothetical protein
MKHQRQTLSSGFSKPSSQHLPYLDETIFYYCHAQMFVGREKSVSKVMINLTVPSKFYLILSFFSNPTIFRNYFFREFQGCEILTPRMLGKIGNNAKEGGIASIGFGTRCASPTFSFRHMFSWYMMLPVLQGAVLITHLCSFQ